MRRHVQIMDLALAETNTLLLHCHASRSVDVTLKVSHRTDMNVMDRFLERFRLIEVQVLRF